MQNSIFKLSSNWKLSVETFMGSDIITIENFYAAPDLVKTFATTPLPPLWKIFDSRTKNGCFYQDRRLQADLTEPVFMNGVNILAQLCGQEPMHDKTSFVSNNAKFYKHPYNNIADNYFWPHVDEGYNAIIYLNDEIDGEYPGTALYHPEDWKHWDKTTAPPPEGTNPWIPKSEYRLVKHIPGKYNRCVLFDGYKFPHAMHINDYTFFGDFYRVNHVHFFKPIGKNIYVIQKTIRN